MNTNKRRVETITNQNAAASQLNLSMALDDADAVNVHGILACLSLEPENADANANGSWALYCIPGGVIQNSDLPSTIGGLGNEDSAPYLWGLGCWVASNQGPFNLQYRPKTSRNCQKGARILLRITFDGVSAGLVRANLVLSAFTTS